MKVLFLHNTKSKDLKAEELIDWLKARQEEVFSYTEKLDLKTVSSINPEIIVSYGYKYILKREILGFPGKGCINLHISYLPFNRGVDPNIWSFLENTPKGVTIHYIDEGIDTGNIIAQKEVVIDEDKETLRSSYQKLQEEIVILFKENWEKIRAGGIKPEPQRGGGGSVHFYRNANSFVELIAERGWNTLIVDLKKKYRRKIIVGEESINEDRFYPHPGQASGDNKELEELGRD